MNGIRNPNKRPRDKKKASDRKKLMLRSVLRKLIQRLSITCSRWMIKDYYVPDVDDYENLTRGFEVVVKLTEKMVEKAKTAKKAYWMKPEDDYEA